MLLHYPVIKDFEWIRRIDFKGVLKLEDHKKKIVGRSIQLLHFVCFATLTRTFQKFETFY